MDSRTFNADLFFAILGEDLAPSVLGGVLKGYARQRFADRYLKKYRPRGVQNTVADAEALAKFLAVNGEARDVKPVIEPEVLGEMQDFIHRVLERHSYFESLRMIERLGLEGVSPIAGTTLNLPLVVAHWAIGPGNNADVRGSHFVQKMSQKLTYSNKAYEYRRYLAAVSPRVFNPRKSSGEAFRDVQQVLGSKIVCVPKTPEISRVIAKEPVLNMCLQLAAGKFIQGALSRIGLDIPTQQLKNRILARIGSEVGDQADSPVTLDLESASDLITPQLCKMLLPPEWYDLLSRIRSEQASVKGVGVITLNSMSTMGNGFTFPLMTLILTAAVYAINRVYFGCPRFVAWHENAVYGDDIIVLRSRYDKLVGLLTGMGLRVNSEKSYADGYFRESCGGDYYQGYDVTPVYVKDLTSLQGRVIALNQLISWSCRHLLWLDAIEYLASTIPRSKLFRVPMWESDDAGIKTCRYQRTYKALRFKSQAELITLPPWLKLASALGGYIESDPEVSCSDSSKLRSLEKVRDARCSFIPRDATIRFYIEKSRTNHVWAGREDSTREGWREQIALAIGV